MSAIESNFPDLGEHSGSSLNTQSERIIGDMIMQKIHGSNFYVADPAVNEYLKHLAHIFTKEAQDPDLKLHFFGVDTQELNAFAFFGGHVAVHSGLILAVENESELAAVLAHETAHITQRHLARILAASRQRMPLTFAEILAAIAIGSLGAPDAGFHLATAALAGHMQHMINFTREHEQEADRIGIQLLSKTQFDPAAMATVFQRMKQNSIYYEMPPEYLLTHPVFDSRIADAQNRAEAFPYRKIPSSLFFYLVRARLEVAKEENTHKKINRLKEQLNSGKTPNKTAAEYSYALALLKNQQTKEALPLLQELVKQNPGDWLIELGLIEAEQAAKLTLKALERSKALLEAHPKNYALMLQYANLLLQNKQPEKVTKLLMPYRKEYANEPDMQQLLAKAYSMAQKPIELHRAQAEWHFAKGEFKEALQQLDLALEYAENKPMEAARIQDRKISMQKIIDQQQEMRL